MPDEQLLSIQAHSGNADGEFRETRDPWSLMTIHLVVENSTDRPLVLTSIDGFVSDDKHLEQNTTLVSAGSLNTIPWAGPTAPIPAGKAILIPIASVALPPDTPEFTIVDSNNGPGPDLHASYRDPAEMYGQRIESFDVDSEAQAASGRIVGPLLIPKTVTTSVDDVSQVSMIRSLDLTRLTALDSDYEIGG